MIARKTLPFLKKNCTITCDHEMQKWTTFCKLRSQEKLYHFSRKTIQFLLIANCRSRIGPLSANYDHKKNYIFLKKNYTNFWDRELQKRATFCKLRSQEKLDHFSTKTIQFLVIVNCRNGPLSANYDRRKNYTVSPDRELQKWATFCELRL